MGANTRLLSGFLDENGKISASNLTGSIPASAINNESLANVSNFSNLILEFDKVINVVSDPSPLEEGMIWYNSTDRKLKVAIYDTISQTVIAKTIQLG